MILGYCCKCFLKEVKSTQLMFLEKVPMSIFISKPFFLSDCVIPQFIPLNKLMNKKVPVILTVFFYLKFTRR